MSFIQLIMLMLVLTVFYYFSILILLPGGPQSIREIRERIRGDPRVTTEAIGDISTNNYRVTTKMYPRARETI